MIGIRTSIPPGTVIRPASQASASRNPTGRENTPPCGTACSATSGKVFTTAIVADADLANGLPFANRRFQPCGIDHVLRLQLVRLASRQAERLLLRATDR